MTHIYHHAPEMLTAVDRDVPRPSAESAQGAVAVYVGYRHSYLPRRSRRGTTRGKVRPVPRRPCEKFMRTIFIPALRSIVSFSTAFVFGPIVQMMPVERVLAGGK